MKKIVVAGMVFLLLSAVVWSRGPKEELTAPEAAFTIEWVAWEDGWSGPADPKKNLVGDEILKKTGVRIKYTPWKVSSQENITTRLNIWANTNDWPQLLQIPPETYAIELANSAGANGQLWDVKEVAAKRPNFYGVAAAGLKSFQNRDDGGQYIMPGALYTAHPSDYNGSGVVIRQDLLKELGMDYPQSADELLDFLRAVKKKIKTPAGTPMIPMTFGPDGAIEGLQRYFMGSPEWQMDPATGQYVISHFSFMDRLEKLVLFLNTAYEEGLLDPEAYILKEEQIIEKIAAGKVASLAGFAYYFSANLAMIEDDPDQFMVWNKPFYDELVPKEYRYIFPYDVRGFAINVMSKPKVDNDLLEATLDVFDWMCTLEGSTLMVSGVESVHWEYDSEGFITQSQTFLDRLGPDEDPWETGALEGVEIYVGLAMDYTLWGSKTAPDYWIGDREDFRVCLENVGITQWKKLDDVIDVVGTSKIEGRIRPDLDEAWKQMMLKAVTADSQAETKKILAGWPETARRLGYEDMLAEKNAMVKAFK